MYCQFIYLYITHALYYPYHCHPSCQYVCHMWCRYLRLAAGQCLCSSGLVNIFELFGSILLSCKVDMSALIMSKRQVSFRSIFISSFMSLPLLYVLSIHLSCHVLVSPQVHTSVISHVDTYALHHVYIFLVSVMEDAAILATSLFAWTLVRHIIFIIYCQQK